MVPIGTISESLLLLLMKNNDFTADRHHRLILWRGVKTSELNVIT
jgi:hypothetical protein